MKIHKPYGNSDLFEIILPFGDGIAGWNGNALHDDCPLCQELKKKIENGEVVEEEWEDENTH